MASPAPIFCITLLVTFFGTGICQAGNVTNHVIASGDSNGNCVQLGVQADGLLEQIDPKKFLFVDASQKSHLQQACDKYKQMRTQSNCVPDQKNSIYDYACGTILELATNPDNGACWSRTSSCALLNLLPPTDSITAAYCKFLTATNIQIGCAMELAPPCGSPANAAMSEAVVKGRSFLDTFQCAKLTPALSALISGNGSTPSAPELPAAGTSLPAAGTSPELPALPAFGNRKSTEPPMVLTSKMPNCDFGQNAKGLMCASTLLGIQERFSDSEPFILQELAKENSSELTEICVKFSTYHSCMFNDVFQNGSTTCLTKGRFHDFSLLFYTFCDPANQPRIKRSGPCVRKLVQNTDQKQLDTFNQCKGKLIAMRANVRTVLKQKENALEMCKGLFNVQAFFDCVKPLVVTLCDKQSLDDMSFFGQEIAKKIDSVGCPVNDPRLTALTASPAGTVTVPIASPAGTTKPESPVTPRSPTTPIELSIKSPNVSIIDSASTVGPDVRTMSRVNVSGDVCTESELSQFAQCYSSISNIDFHPMTIITNPDQSAEVCQSFVTFQECKSALTCYPPAGDGLDNMLSFFCDEDSAELKKYQDCLKRVADSDAGKSCKRRVMLRNLPSMNNDQICTWINELAACSYAELSSKCNIDAADYQFKIWQAFAKGVNTSCEVELPEFSNETIIGVPVMCNAAESAVVEKCVEPFTAVMDRLSSMLEGGMQSFMRGMRRITEMFKTGCNTRIGFDDCMRKSIPQGSQCRTSSCLIKVTEYACNFTGDSDMTLEDRLKCLWSMIGEPEFTKCLKLIPKHAFQDLNRLKMYLARFVNCLEQPLLRKCGQTTLSLVKALSSQATSDPKDQTCVVHVPGLNDQNATLVPAVTGAVETAAGNHAIPPAGPVIPGAGAAPATTVVAAAVTTAAPKPEGTTPSAVTDTRPLCRKEEETAQVAQCHQILRENQYEPTPVKLFNSVADLDPACNAYKNFSSCLRSIQCRYEFSSAIQEILLRVCTVRYDNYKENGHCLIALADGPVGGRCITPMNLTEIQTDGGEKVCGAINRLMGCIKPDLMDRCPTATDLVYDVHTAFAKQFKPDCEVKPPVLLVGGTDCTQPEVTAFQGCMNKTTNYGINPITVISEPNRINEFCTFIQTDLHQCLSSLNCTPEPYNAAFNDTYSYVCTSDEVKGKLAKYGPCLGNVLNTAVGQQCMESYKSIGDWYGGENPKGIPDRICKGFTSALSCAAPEISQRCEQEAVQLVYGISQRMVSKVKNDCHLTMPANLPTKLNMTTSTEASTEAKTTPAKAKEAPTAPTSGGHLASMNWNILVGCALIYYSLTWFA